MFIIISLWFT